MDKYNVRFLQTALDDLEEILLYIAVDSKTSALSIYERILEKAERLSHFPLIGTVCPDSKLKKMGYRILVVDNYLLFYKILDDEVLIMRVSHGARDYPNLFSGMNGKEE